MANIFDDLNSADETAVDGKAPPSQKVVDWFHAKASIGRPEDIHHPIGYGETDAAPGNHTHDGKNSKFLFPTSVVLTDLGPAPTSLQIQAAVNNINAALRLLGAQ